MEKQQTPNLFWTVDKIAEHLSVSIRTVRRWIADEKLIAHHFGGAVRISTADFRSFLKNNRHD